MTHNLSARHDSENATSPVDIVVADTRLKVVRGAEREWKVKRPQIFKVEGRVGSDEEKGWERPLVSDPRLATT